MAIQWSVVLLTLGLTVLRGVFSQMVSCPELEAPSTSCSFNNCTSLTCQFGRHESLTFVVDGCVDPAQVVVTVRNELHELEVQQIFNRSGVITLIGGRMLNVDMSRNATHMDFAVSLSNLTSAAITTVPVVPQYFVPLTPDICMCKNIRNTAIRSSLLSSCSANDNCNGVICAHPFGRNVFIEILILPCLDSVELLVNEMHGMFFSTIINETGRFHTSMDVYDITIVSRTYSMDVSAAMEIGRVEVFPLHTIILDRTHCNQPNFTTLPPPPPPTPLPPPDIDSSPTCQDFYAAIKKLITAPLVCDFLGGDCDAGISCTLTLLNLKYTLTVQYINETENFVFRVLDQDGHIFGSGNTDLVTVDLPSPLNTSLMFSQGTEVYGVIGIQIDLSLPVDVDAIEVHTLLPFSRIALAEEQCLAFIQVTSDPDTTCATSGACTSLTCQFGQHESLTIVVDGCVDPAQVVITVRNELHELEAQQIFNRSGVISLIGGRMLNVDMSRNATHMDFAVSLSNLTSAATATVPVVPQFFAPLIPDICMCKNIRNFSSVFAIHSSSLPNCSANANCDGVICAVSYGRNVFTEILILPCIDSVELLIENEVHGVIFNTIFNETGRTSHQIRNVPVTYYITIESRTYSMDVAADTESFVVGRSVFFPLHTIILDRTHCNLPNFTTLPPPPPPTPLPPPDVDSSPACQDFYSTIRELFTEPFVCGFLGGDCDAGISCTLTILNLKYTLIVGRVKEAENFVFRVLDQDGQMLGSGETSLVTVDLPSPSDTSLMFSQGTVEYGVIGIQINISFPVDVGAIEVHTLLPLSQIALAEEQCQALIQATSDPDTTCIANGDCTGLSCDLDASSNMVFVVDKCKDPVVVNVTTFHGGVSAVNSLIQNDRIFLGGGEYLAVTMSRNETDLDFMAFVTRSTQSNEQLRPVVPQVLVPLNTSDCMCESMVQLAARAGHSDVETDCEANSDCSGVRCQVTVSGAIYRVQGEVSACDEDLFIEMLVDGEENPRLLTQVNQSGRYVIEVVPGFPLIVDMILERRDYSVLIAATIDEPIYGLIEIVPRHLLILDRTSCNHRNFTTLPPPIPVMPPPGPGGSVSDTCKALYDVVLDHFMEPFTCHLLVFCDRGIQCMLEILDTRYDVELLVSCDSKSILMEVQFEGEHLLTRESGGVINVTLPRPMLSNLSLSQDFDPKRASVTMQLDLYVFALDGTPTRDVLISRTEIPVDSSSSTDNKSTVVVATVVPILLLIAVMAVVGVIITAVLIMRKKQKIAAFDFQLMPNAELQTKTVESRYSDGIAGSVLRPSGKGEMGGASKGGEGDKEAIL